MKKKTTIFILTLIMSVPAFAQGIKLNVSKGELVFKETWYRNYMESSQTIVEVKSPVPLTFSSTTDAGITQMDKKPEEAGYYFYELIFPTTTSKKEYGGRILSIKSNGFETVKYPLPSLESNKPVALLVMREADALFNARNYAEAQVEYEKEANRNSSNEYLKSRIVACKDNLSVQKADTLYNAQNFSASLLEYKKISSAYFNREYVNKRIILCNDAILLEEANKLINDGMWKNALIKLNAISEKNEGITEKIKRCEDKIKEGSFDTYTLILEDADNHFRDGDYKGGLLLYTDLQSSRPNDYVQQQIIICENKLLETIKREADLLYKQQLQTANDSLKAKNYEAALELYRQLHSDRPDDKDVTQQINYCKERLKEKRLAEKPTGTSSSSSYTPSYNSGYSRSTGSSGSSGYRRSSGGTTVKKK